MTVNGQNFVAGSSSVSLGGVALTTNVVSPNQLTFTVPASALASTGLKAVQVKNLYQNASNIVYLKVVERGDINGNSSVNIGDILALARNVALLTGPPLPVAVGDFNLDGVVSLGDVLTLARFSGQVDPDLPVPLIVSA